MENEEMKQVVSEEVQETSGKRKQEKKSMPVVMQIILLAVLVVVLRNVMGTVLVKGSSMEPNFNHGDLVFINKLSTSVGSPDYGDVVICKLDEGASYENIIKRVIGLPGDEIYIVESDYDDEVFELYVNGEYGMYGVSSQPVLDGETYTFKYEVYVAE